MQNRLAMYGQGGGFRMITLEAKVNHRLVSQVTLAGDIKLEQSNVSVIAVVAIAKCLHLCPLSNYRGVKSATSVFQYCVKLCFFLLQINCKLYEKGTHCAGIRRHMWSYVIRGELEIMMMKIGWYWK